MSHKDDLLRAYEIVKWSDIALASRLRAAADKCVCVPPNPTNSKLYATPQQEPAPYVAPGELESLRVFQRKIEEAEARCCPEDVGFEEYIAALKKRLAIPSNMEDRFLIQECATWIRRLAARIKQYQPQLAKKAVDWLHRKEIQGSPLRDAETISDSETLEVRKEREGYETAIALSYECDRLREELAKARSAIEPSIKSALQWAAQWIEDSAKGADQSVVSFAQNMAMTLRSNGAAEAVRSQP